MAALPDDCEPHMIDRQNDREVQVGVEKGFVQTVLVALNPRSGGQERSGLIRDCLQAIEFKGFKAIAETSVEALCELAHEERAAGRLRAVVSAGGDGTLALWANRLPSDVAIAVLPLGTENIVAKCLGCRASAADLATTLAEGREVQWDAGVANGRIFLAMLGAGFDAEVVRRLHSARRGHISYLSYVSPILQTIATYRYPEMRIVVWPEEGAEPIALPARWAFIANLARYALGLEFCPTAEPSDGLLDGAFFARSGLLSGLRYLWKIRRGRHVADPSVRCVSGVRFRLESEQPAAYQLDGDPGGVLPVEVSVAPGRLRLLVPPSYSRRSKKDR